MAQTPLPRHLIAEHARFSTQDRVQIARCRRAYNRLGFAYQLAFLRLMGRFPHQQPLEMHEDLLAYVAQQLDLDTSEIPSYAQRQATASAHAEQLRVYLGYRTFGEAQRALLVAYVREEVEHLEQTAALLAKAEQFLRRQKILLPARRTLHRLIIEERAVHREHLLDRMSTSCQKRFAFDSTGFCSPAMKASAHSRG